MRLSGPFRCQSPAIATLPGSATDETECPCPSPMTAPATGPAPRRPTGARRSSGPWDQSRADPVAPSSGGGRPGGSGNGSQSRGGQPRPARAGSTGVERRPSSPRRVEPALPDDVTGRELDRAVRAELTSLASQNAEAVSRHLVMAGRLLDDDPEAAYAHAVAARDRAGRVAAVREAAGLAAYLTGRYAEALAELRAARRMSGDQSALPVMADCERGLGRPEKALAIASSPEVATLDAAGRAEMLIVASGARRDLGQPDAAALLLQGPELRARATARLVGPAVLRLRRGAAGRRPRGRGRALVRPRRRRRRDRRDRRRRAARRAGRRHRHRARRRGRRSNRGED